MKGLFFVKSKEKSSVDQTEQILKKNEGNSWCLFLEYVGKFKKCIQWNTFSSKPPCKYSISKSGHEHNAF